MSTVQTVSLIVSIAAAIISLAGMLVSRYHHHKTRELFHEHDMEKHS